MSESGYKMKMRKGELEIEVMGDKEFVMSKFEELARMTFEMNLGSRSTLQPPATSLVEFLKEKNPISQNDKVIVFAYYLHKFKGLNSYNIDDIDRCYSDSRTPKPQNINDTMNANVKRGFLMVSDEKKDGKKAWIITQTGERYVDAGLREDK